jgi:hypothetical protein
VPRVVSDLWRDVSRRMADVNARAKRATVAECSGRNTRDLLDIKHTGAEATRSAERQESASRGTCN